MKKMFTKIMLPICCAVLVVIGSHMVSGAYRSFGYGGTVTKYADFESSSLKKSDKTQSATNNAATKPNGTFDCWIEVSSTGSNCTYKTAYSSTGKYYMPYKQNFDSPDTCAENLYDLQYNLKLNISTVLANFNSGSVSGVWSPDTY